MARTARPQNRHCLDQPASAEANGPSLNIDLGCIKVVDTFRGVCSSLGQWMVILSLRFTPVSSLAPYSYTALLWTTIAGFLAFGVLPDQWTLAGAVVIVASGLYTANRERRR